MELKDSVIKLKGVGEKTAALFEKVGVFTILDLLQYYPRAYEIYESPVECSQIVTRQKYAVQAWVTEVSEVQQVGRYQIFEAKLKVGQDSMQAVWFNMPFMQRFFRRGGQFIFRGFVSVEGNKYRMEQPEYFTLAQYDSLLHVMQPKYSLTAGLTKNLISKMVRQILDSQKVFLPEYLPAWVLETYHLEPEWESIKNIHFPADNNSMQKARRRLVFDEFLFFVLGLKRMKKRQEHMKNSAKMLEVAETKLLIEALPYRLTKAQNKVWREIVADMSGERTMNRLIQGDVGSGKTILAVLALVMAGYNGYQGALMAPTEVLAKQHFLSISELFRKHKIGLKLILLVGSMTVKEKQLACEEIESGRVQIIIGTHALIQENVDYQRLGLVVTDEQHRFGVRQRDILAGKGIQPHVLVMSATPIPRTLAIIIYGDLDISVLDELPLDRLPVKNCVVNESYRPSAYRFMEKEAAKGHQIYIICPMVEENEELELQNVIDYTKKLKQILPGLQISYLHGKMKAREKNDIMERFSQGQIQILVSTTVVEVGINVPNATVMMVENAERFGLAQLHQLRGRVGRGKAQSYCIFMSNSKTETARKRLEVLNRSNDGFYIANEDLKLRGPGDLFGIRQSGLLEFQIGDVFQDAAIMGWAAEAANKILEDDPNLETEKNQMLRERLDWYCRRGGEQLSL